METVVIALQILCVAVLASGTALSLYQLVQGRNERFGYTAANDFETGFRRLARIRR